MNWYMGGLLGIWFLVLAGYVTYLSIFLLTIQGIARDNWIREDALQLAVVTTAMVIASGVMLITFGGCDFNALTSVGAANIMIAVILMIQIWSDFRRQPLSIYTRQPVADRFPNDWNRQYQSESQRKVRQSRPPA